MINFNESLIQQIKTLSISMDKAINADLKRLNINLTGGQIAILTVINQTYPAPVLQQSIEYLLHLSHPTTRGFIKRLERDGYLKTARNPDDKRQTLLYLTSEGRELMEDKLSSIETQLKSLEKNITAGLTKDEIKKLKKYLHHIQHNLD